jgi:cyclopropane fatty-acyl-phospholipid synthase-like methyltransferase
MKINDYERLLTREELEQGAHREFVGGMWNEIGQLSFDFMLKNGLEPSMKLLDIGCGSLRCGVHFVRHLNHGHYFGIDANSSLIDAGFNIELPQTGLQAKLPRSNLMCDEDFAISRFNTKFDRAIALSVFTHLPLNHIRLCLIELVKSMDIGGRFFATFFLCSDSESWEAKIVHSPGGVNSYPANDPYHYKLDDVKWLISGLSWSLEYIGDWDHPRNQKMVCFTKI